MAAPTLTLSIVSGAAGGPAPHHAAVRVNYASSSTGDSSRWEQGYFEWRWKIDGATPTTRISCTDPINGTTRYLDANQHGANAAILALDAGEAVIEAKYTNSTGEAGTWTAATAITVTARGSDECFVDGARADDTGDGLSWATAKKTWNACIAVLNTLGAGATMWVRDCTCTASTTVTADNVYIEKDPLLGATIPRCTITGNFNACTAGASTDGLVIGEIEFYNASGTGRVVSCSDSQTQSNICLWKTHYNNLDDVTVGEGAADILGLSHIKIVEDASNTGQVHFTASTTGFKAWGVSIPSGSTAEHTYRLGHGGLYENEFHSFDYCLINNAETSKCWIRWYANSDLWVHGCDLRSRGYIGSHSPGDGALGGTTVCFDRCRFRTYSGQATDFAIRLHSGWEEITFRNCYWDGIVCLFVPRNNEAATYPGATCNDICFISCEFRSGGGQSINLEYVATTNTPTGIVVRNCRFRGGNSGSNRYLWIKNTSAMTGYDFQGNVFERTDGQNVARNIATNGDLNFTQYTALTGVSNETQVATTTVDATTLEPDNGLTTGVTGAPMAFASYYNAYRYDPDAANYPSGAWLSSDAAVVLRYFINTAGGSLLLTTEG
jgi:hypothetical protein